MGAEDNLDRDFEKSHILLDAEKQVNKEDRKNRNWRYEICPISI